MQEETTNSIELLPIALKLRTMRLQKDISLSVVSKVCKISIDDLCTWEMGKAGPPKDLLERLVNFYS